MKRRIFAALAVAFVVGLLTEALVAQYRTYPSSRRGDPRSSTGRTTRPRRGISDVNSLIKDLPFLKDPNTVTANVSEFEGLQTRIDGVCKQGGKEFGNWTRIPIEDPARLATEVQKQIIAEMAMIRELAAEEGAAKTVAAIDSLLIDRQQRLDKVVKRIGVKDRRSRGAEQDMQRGRGSYRDSRRRGAYQHEGRSGRSQYGREQGYRESSRYNRRGRYEEEETERPRRRRVTDTPEGEDDEPAEEQDPEP